MKTWKKVTLGTVALGSAALLAACGSGSGSASKSSRAPQLAIPTDITTLDSSMATDTYSNIFIGNTEEGATRVNAEGKAVPALAKSVEASSDGLTYTIKLRDGLKWSNGDALTAKDFVYAWQRAVNPKTGSQYAYLMANIKGASEIMASKADPSTLGIKQVSDTEFTVTLTTPTPYFDFLLSQSVYYPLNQKFVEKYGKEYGTSSDKTLYSGPFVFKGKGWTGTNGSFKLVKNPDYWDKKNVKSDEIDYQVVKNPNTAVQLYKQGKIDQATLPTPDLYNANKGYTKNTKLVKLKEATTDYIEYNQTGKGTSNPTAAKALQNKNIREALNLATDRATIVAQTTAGSTVATGLTPAGMAKTSDGTDFAEYAAQPYTYDPAKAKTLWEKGLKEIGATSVNLSYETDADSPTAKQQADFLQTSLAKNLPGLTITEKIVPFQQRLKDSQNHQFDMVNSLWGGDYAEPSTFLSLFIKGSGYNDGGFVNPTYQAAWDKASTLPDVTNDDARNADYKAAEKALYDESSINPIYFRTTPALRNTAMKGLQFNSTGLNYDLKGVYIK
ncbi:MAG: peptide ABC transporter substrate-binding protein [Streptococcaceae bacterium]|nr:peptide ABC transporter substrate-binding protein [Streptococcaceae bacterium]